MTEKILSNFKIDPKPIGFLFISSAFLFVFYIIWVPIRLGQLGYTVGEILMNYQFGFYRRAFVGNFFVLISNKIVLLSVITLLFSGCLITPLVLAKTVSTIKTGWWNLVVLFILFYSPFGIALYLKDPLAIRKELFFFPLFLLLISCKNDSVVRTNVLVIVCIVMGSLIHESFFFLFFPFLIWFLWLAGWLDKKWLWIHLLVGIGATLFLSLAQGNSDDVTEQFIRNYISLGFEREQFAAFEHFQKLPSSENIAEAFQHFRGINPFIYFALYVGQFYFIYQLLRFFNVRIRFNNPKALLMALGTILFLVFLLCFIAMDYGRWLAMAFLTSIILIVSQIKTVAFLPLQKPVVFHLLAGLAAVGVMLFLRIPHFTNPGFDWNDWITDHKLFILNGAFWSIALAGLLLLRRHFRVGTNS